MKLRLGLILAGLVFVVSNIYSFIDGEIWTGMQLNYPGVTAVSPPIGRLRLFYTLETPVENLEFRFRFTTLYGRQYFGSTPLLTPANNVVVTNYNIAIDTSYIAYHNKFIHLYIGMIDPQNFEIDKGGFFNFGFVGNDNTGFLSTHFQRQLANHGLDYMTNPTIPSLFMRINITDYLLFRGGVTFGLALEHIFVRNSFPMELVFHTDFLRISINASLADADSSEVHKVSPALGTIVEIKPFYPFMENDGVLANLTFFARYSQIYPEWNTFRSPEWSLDDPDRFRVAREFTHLSEHLAVGLASQTEKAGFGIAYSHLKHFGSAVAEEVLEFFFRVRMLKIFEISPSLQVVLNPGGSLDYPHIWRTLPEFEFLFDPNTTTETRYAYIVGARILYEFSLPPFRHHKRDTEKETVLIDNDLENAIQGQLDQKIDKELTTIPKPAMLTNRIRRPDDE
jgi:hypothetical protein